MIRIYCIFSLFIIFFTVNAQTYIVRGFVADSTTNEFLHGANVFTNTQKSTTSDSTGFFEIKVDSKDSSICVSYLGYRNECQFVKNILNYNFKLLPIAIQTEEIEIKANASRPVESIQTGYTELSRKEISNIPYILGERDPIKALQLTPGVSKTEAGQSFIVRGGSSDQNLVILDGATVYNPSHLLGIFSVFNPLTINNVKLIKAGMPVEFGGRLSSILDVETTQPNLSISEGEINAGLILSNIYFSTPIIKDKVSVSFAVRRSYIDELIKPALALVVKNKAFKSIKYNFTDFNSKILVQLNQNNQFNINIYFGGDNFGLNQDIILLENTMNWNNKLISFQWRYYNKSFKMSNTLYYTDYKMKFIANQDVINFILKSSMSELSLKTKYELEKFETKILCGHEIGLTNFSPIYSKASMGNLSSEMGTSNIFKVVNAAGYISLERNISEKILIYTGVRTNFHYHIGPYTTYSRDFQSRIIDTLYVSKNKIVYKLIKPEFRASIRYMINKISSVKCSYTDNYQTILQVSSTSVSMPTDFWVPATNSIAPQKCRQISLGYYRNIVDKEYVFSFESYLKDYTNQIEIREGLMNTITKKSFEDNLIFGKGISFGGEFFLTKKKGNITGWISYTIARSIRMFNEINEGDFFPSKYDRTHDLSVVASYRFNEKWLFSGVFIYATGNAFTLPNGRYIVQGNLLNQYGRYNSYRLPPYHRVDVSATRFLQKRKNMESEINFSVFNIYNRSNPFYVYVRALGNFNTYDIDIKPESVSLLPILPSVTYIIRFK